jgi:hypothetical protein
MATVVTVPTRMLYNSTDCLCRRTVHYDSNGRKNGTALILEQLLSCPAVLLMIRIVRPNDFV